MGFSEYEKKFLQSIIEPDEVTEVLRREILTTSALHYLEANDYLRRVKDYLILPTKYLHKKYNTENIIINKFVSSNFILHDFVDIILEELSPPFTVKIDFSFLIVNPLSHKEHDPSADEERDLSAHKERDPSAPEEGDPSAHEERDPSAHEERDPLSHVEHDDEEHDRRDYRYVFPQRSTALPFVFKIYEEKDAAELLTILKPLTLVELQSMTYDCHRNQSCFDKSGYIAHSLLTCVLFLSKISTLHAPIPID